LLLLLHEAYQKVLATLLGLFGAPPPVILRPGIVADALPVCSADWRCKNRASEKFYQGVRRPILGPSSKLVWLVCMV